MTKKMVEPVYKYAVYPGWVRSKDDNNEHYVSFPELCKLYKVDPTECLPVIYPPSQFPPPVVPDELTPLFPRKDGNYELPDT